MAEVGAAAQDPVRVGRRSDGIDAGGRAVGEVPVGAEPVDFRLPDGAELVPARVQVAVS
ncbi:hypothetical protein [Streptomyces sp. NPDC102437]|uniref:hypothetical protein n=1 Tax=Streptomyces sp. NPDC102437 TaxID=3366175 RepID=UPI00380C02E9